MVTVDEVFAKVTAALSARQSTSYVLEITNGSCVVRTEKVGDTRHISILFFRDSDDDKPVGKVSIPAEFLTAEKQEDWRNWVLDSFAPDKDATQPLRIHIPERNFSMNLTGGGRDHGKIIPARSHEGGRWT